MFRLISKHQRGYLMAFGLRTDEVASLKNNQAVPIRLTDVFPDWQPTIVLARATAKSRVDILDKDGVAFAISLSPAELQSLPLRMVQFNIEYRDQIVILLLFDLAKRAAVLSDMAQNGLLSGEICRDYTDTTTDLPEDPAI
jgi:hypothetical protein